MRRFLTGLLCLSMLSSLSVPAFASDNMQGSTGVTITVEGQGDSGGGQQRRGATPTEVVEVVLKPVRASNLAGLMAKATTTS